MQRLNDMSTSELVTTARNYSASITEIGIYSELVKEITDRLAANTAAVNQALKERDAVVAENAALKAGSSYFSYGSEHNFECHKTAEEAVEAAEAAIDDYRGDACDGWSEEVDSICWGIIMQSSTKVGERPRNEDDCCDPAINTICDYALLPNIETLATDAALADIEARGVEKLATFAGEEYRRDAGDRSLQRKWKGIVLLCTDFARQLRKGAELNHG